MAHRMARPALIAAEDLRDLATIARYSSVSRVREDRQPGPEHSNLCISMGGGRVHLVGKGLARSTDGVKSALERQRVQRI
jgi:hypothetical protein